MQSADECGLWLDPVSDERYREATTDSRYTEANEVLTAREVENMIALSSYMATLLTMSLAMGPVFEIPILSWLLEFARLGFLSFDFIHRCCYIHSRKKRSPVVLRPPYRPCFILHSERPFYPIFFVSLSD